MISSLLFLLAINVSTLATAGNGTAVSPWTGWDTAFSWVADQQYNFSSGVYAYTDSPNFLKTGIALVGEAGTILKHTGSGNAVVFDNPGTDPVIGLRWTFGVRMENFIIQGNAATTNGLFLRGVRNSTFRNISVRDVSNAGIWTEACVTNVLDNFRVSHWEILPGQAFNVVPQYGIVFAARGSDTTTTWTVINPVIEGVSVAGIWTQLGSVGNAFINGTSEGNTGKGAVFESDKNTIINTWFEANGGNNIELNRPRQTLINVTSGPLVISPNSHMNQISGEFSSLTVQGVNNVLQGAIIGSLTDNGSNTYKIGYAINGQARAESKLANYLPTLTGLSIVGGVVSTNALGGSLFSITANQNFLLDNPTNPTNGQKITWRIGMSSGTATISYGSKFRTSPGVPFPTLPFFQAGSYVYISATYNSLRDTWDMQ